MLIAYLPRVLGTESPMCVAYCLLVTCYPLLPSDLLSVISELSLPSISLTITCPAQHRSGLSWPSAQNVDILNTQLVDSGCWTRCSLEQQSPLCPGRDTLPTFSRRWLNPMTRDTGTGGKNSSVLDLHNSKSPGMKTFWFLKTSENLSCWEQTCMQCSTLFIWRDEYSKKILGYLLVLIKYQISKALKKRRSY